MLPVQEQQVGLQSLASLQQPPAGTVPTRTGALGQVPSGEDSTVVESPPMHPPPAPLPEPPVPLPVEAGPTAALLELLDEPPNPDVLSVSSPEHAGAAKTNATASATSRDITAK